MEWTAETLAAARSQGWTLMSHDRTSGLFIGKVDDEAEPGDKVCFEWDEDAQEFVQKQADLGDPLAQAALAFVATNPHSEED